MQMKYMKKDLKPKIRVERRSSMKRILKVEKEKCIHKHNYDKMSELH